MKGLSCLVHGYANLITRFSQCHSSEFHALGTLSQSFQVHDHVEDWISVGKLHSKEYEHLEFYFLSLWFGINVQHIFADFSIYALKLLRNELNCSEFLRESLKSI